MEKNIKGSFKNTVLVLKLGGRLMKVYLKFFFITYIV